MIIVHDNELTVLIVQENEFAEVIVFGNKLTVVILRSVKDTQITVIIEQDKTIDLFLILAAYEANIARDLLNKLFVLFKCSKQPMTKTTHNDKILTVVMVKTIHLL